LQSQKPTQIFLKLHIFSILKLAQFLQFYLFQKTPAKPITHNLQSFAPEFKKSPPMSQTHLKLLKCPKRVKWRQTSSRKNKQSKRKSASENHAKSFRPFGLVFRLHATSLIAQRDTKHGTMKCYKNDKIRKENFGDVPLFLGIWRGIGSWRGTWL
jgi:hypothetical protein